MPKIPTTAITALIINPNEQARQHSFSVSAFICVVFLISCILNVFTRSNAKTNIYSEHQNKVYIRKIIMLINYRYFYLKIV